MGGGLVDGGEDTGGLDNVVSTSLTPGDGGRVTLGEDLDGLAVDDELAVLGGDVALEDTVGGVVCSIQIWEQRSAEASTKVSIFVLRTDQMKKYYRSPFSSFFECDFAPFDCAKTEAGLKMARNTCDSVPDRRYLHLSM